MLNSSVNTRATDVQRRFYLYMVETGWKHAPFKPPLFCVIPDADGRNLYFVEAISANIWFTDFDLEGELNWIQIATADMEHA